MVKIAFVTCVQIGLSCIEEIFRIGGKLDLLITLKDDKSKNKSGRIYLDKIAEKYNVPLLKVNNVNDKEVVERLNKDRIDWLFIIGWSQIARSELLNTPKKGCIGMHPSLLPKGRGRAAIPWAILKGLDKTGVTMFRIDEGVDTGDIISQGEIKLDKETDATKLYDKVNKMHTKLIRDKWSDILSNNIYPKKQDEKLATVWNVRKPEDGQILKDMTMEKAHTLIRATTRPYPGAFYISKGKRIIIWKAKKSRYKGNIKLKDGYLQFIDYEIINNKDKRFQFFIKRTLDILFSLFVLTFLFPIWLLVAILIKISSKGPIFFKQERPGHNKKIFMVYKFRTMKPGSEQMTKGVEVLKDDNRITKIGKFLRRTKIDEIPQVINILKGDMSLVGPRPERISSLKDYDKEISKRLDVRPGITGLAQVSGNIYLKLNDRYKFDIYYVKNYSFLLDIKIILRTFLVIIFGEDKFKDKPLVKLR